jgi:hypothetical protein
VAAAAAGAAAAAARRAAGAQQQEQPAEGPPVSLLLPGLPLVSPRGGGGGPCGSGGSNVSTPRSRYEASAESISSSGGGARLAACAGASHARGNGLGPGWGPVQQQHHHQQQQQQEEQGPGDGAGHPHSNGGSVDSSSMLMPVMSGRICDQSLSAAAAAAAQQQQQQDEEEAGGGGAEEMLDLDCAPTGCAASDAASPCPKAPGARSSPGVRSPSAGAVAASLAAWRPPMSPERLQDIVREGGGHRGPLGSWSGDWAVGSAKRQPGQQQRSAGWQRGGAGGGDEGVDGGGGERDSRARADDRSPDAAVTRSLPLLVAALGRGSVRLPHGDAMAWLHNNELFEPDGSSLGATPPGTARVR